MPHFLRTCDWNNAELTGMESLLEVVSIKQKIFIGFTAEKALTDLSKFPTSVLSQVQNWQNWISGMTPAVSWWEAQRYAENKSDCAKKKPQTTVFPDSQNNG